jgi:hypothetical protein
VARQRECHGDPAWSENPARTEVSCMGTGRGRGRPAEPVRVGKAKGPKPMMHDRDQSDSLIVCAGQCVNQEG